MPTPVFKRISIDQFAPLLAQFPFTRRINAVHMHHTWRPARRDFRGHETIVSMWRFHTQEQGWRDIAQHVTIDPEGFIWLGRNWNLPPVSASGHNGNPHSGPFMFEMIGNFDRGCDPFDGPQRETALEVVTQLQLRFGLPADSLVFHNAMSGKTCPGSGVEFEQVLAEIESRRSARTRSARRAREAAEPRDAGPFPDEGDMLVREAIEALRRAPVGMPEPGDAEPPHETSDEGAMSLPRGDAAAAPTYGAAPDSRYAPRGTTLARSGPLDAATLASLRPHLVNLRMGRFSREGETSSTPADVDAIFEESLPRALEAARAQGRKFRLLFYAHGGLVSESSGLRTAARHVDWWKRNDVYPIHFVWETGFFETIGQLLARARQGATRGLARDIWDHTLDPLIEAGARLLQGGRIWAGMKSGAEHAVDEPTPRDPQGGAALYVARRLKTFCDAHGSDVELHAAGHSAGSIFHAWFLDAAHALGVPTFETVHFLAPALRTDLFKERFAGRIGDGKAVRRLTIFTMRKDFEKDDDCAGIYHKSLLYLVSNALESERGTPLLGLEESLRADAELKSLFGLDGTPTATGDVVWSVSAGDTGASASMARSHGDFDDDAATMNSVARRVLGKADADAIVAYETARHAFRRAWIDEVDWPDDVVAPGAPAVMPSATPSFEPIVVPAAPLAQPPQPASAWMQPPQTGGSSGSSGPGKPNGSIGPNGSGATVAAGGTSLASATDDSNSAGYAHASGAGEPGRRWALCVGIDRYPDPRHALAGCVADARMWSDALAHMGYATRVLLDEAATREAIARELLALVGASRAGDVLVFQYSGHGTHLPDLDIDEEDGEDEAICPVDFASGALYIDDDIAQVFARIPDGVAMTCFMDCCHSGTNSRFAVGAPSHRSRSLRDERKRYVRPTPELVAAHRRFRRQAGYARSTPNGAGTGGRSRMRDVKFAACLDGEVAWESDGHGEFTLRATQILSAGVQGMSNEQFARRITEAFGPDARQHPMLDCVEGAAALGLLQPLVRADGPSPIASAPAAARVDEALLHQTLLSLQQLLARLPAR